MMKKLLTTTLFAFTLLGCLDDQVSVDSETGSETGSESSSESGDGDGDGDGDSMTPDFPGDGDGDPEPAQVFFPNPKDIYCFEGEECYLKYSENLWTYAYSTCQKDDLTTNATPMDPVDISFCEDLPNIWNPVECFESNGLPICFVEVTPGWWSQLTHECLLGPIPKFPLWGQYNTLEDCQGSLTVDILPFTGAYCQNNSFLCYGEVQNTSWSLPLQPVCSLWSKSSIPVPECN